MTQNQLRIGLGQATSKGVKPLNQDFHGLVAPAEPLLSTKGIAMVMADGISSSQVSHIASQTAVKNFLEDYFATPEAWSVKNSALRVIAAANSWLHSQTRDGPARYDLDKGYICTFSAMVLKSNRAHLFHIGDTRVYRLNQQQLELLTEDHRVQMSEGKSYLGRALGMREFPDLEYLNLPLEVGDIFLQATDGIYEFVDQDVVTETVLQNLDDLDKAASLLVEHALVNGSDDNLSIQIVRILELPHGGIDSLHEQAIQLPFPPELRVGMQFDGFEILRELHHSARSHLYLARDIETDTRVALKVLSVDLRGEKEYLERFLMEEWVARRLDSPFLLKPYIPNRARKYLYITNHYLEGSTLAQWLLDNPRPALQEVRDIVEQVARGLYAMHRQEMLHQDLRPANIMIDSHGRVQIIDFGAVRVAGVAEIGRNPEDNTRLGTAQYTAPEYFMGDPASEKSDLYSLGVIAYQMLSAVLPYGAAVARATSRAAMLKLKYRPLTESKTKAPDWVDFALRKALHPNPDKRYAEISEFVQALRKPDPDFESTARNSMMDRNPILFWKLVSGLLALALILSLATHPLLNS